MMVVFYRVKAYFFLVLHRCNVEDDIVDSLAISDCLNFGCIDLISIIVAIFSNLICLTIKSTLR